MPRLSVDEIKLCLDDEEIQDKREKKKKKEKVIGKLTKIEDKHPDFKP